MYMSLTIKSVAFSHDAFLSGFSSALPLVWARVITYLRIDRETHAAGEGGQTHSMAANADTGAKPASRLP